MLLALGIGAGLRAGELAVAVGDEVTDGPRGVSVQVGGAGGRTVPVNDVYAKTLVLQAKRVGLGYLFCSGRADRAYKNLVNNFCYGLVADPAGPSLSSGRAVQASSATTWRRGRLFGSCSI